LREPKNLPETPDPYELSPAVVERAERIERLARDYDLLMQRVAAAHAPEFLEVVVTMSQAKVLYLARAAGHLRMSELAAKLGVSLSTTSGVVDRLVDHGLLDRHDDPADRRQVVVSITRAGADRLDQFRELSERQLRSLLAQVADSDLVLLERAFSILASAAARQAGPVVERGPSGAEQPADRPDLVRGALNPEGSTL
jgi:DNA-binding MarR family transcriptional regulator